MFGTFWGAKSIKRIFQYKCDRLVEIETGYGVEKILPNTRVSSIIKQMTPRLKQGDYDGGTLVGTKALVTALQGETHSFNKAVTK